MDPLSSTSCNPDDASGMTGTKDLERIKDLENSAEVQLRRCEGGNPFTFHISPCTGSGSPSAAPHADMPGLPGRVWAPLCSGFWGRSPSGPAPAPSTLPALPWGEAADREHLYPPLLCYMILALLIIEVRWCRSCCGFKSQFLWAHVFSCLCQSLDNRKMGEKPETFPSRL